MKKSTLLGLGMLLATTGIAALSSVDVSAHGYVSQPISRGYQGALDSRNNWLSECYFFVWYCNKNKKLEE